jgi:MFS family permease
MADRGVHWETEVYGATGGQSKPKAGRHSTDKKRRTSLKTQQQSSLSRYYDAIAHERVSYVWVIPVIFLQFAAFALTHPLLKQIEVDVLPRSSVLGSHLHGGMLLGLKALVAAIGAPLVGAYSDRHGRCRLLKQTLLASCLPTALLLLLARTWPVGALWMYHIVDLGRCFLSTPTMVLAYTADLIEVSNQRRALAFGTIFAGISVGHVIMHSVAALDAAEALIAAQVALGLAIACVLYAHGMLNESLEGK